MKITNSTNKQQNFGMRNVDIIDQTRYKLLENLKNNIQLKGDDNTDALICLEKNGLLQVKLSKKCQLSLKNWLGFFKKEIITHTEYDNIGISPSDNNLEQFTTPDFSNKILSSIDATIEGLKNKIGTYEDKVNKMKANKVPIYHQWLWKKHDGALSLHFNTSPKE